MMHKISVIVLLIAVILMSCNNLKTYGLLKKGKVDQTEFKIEIPFEYRLGLIVINVKIKGKDYDFLLDTGAPNLLSTQLAEKLKIMPSVSSDVDDSGGERAKLDFVLLDTVNIGGLNFINTGAVIADLNKSYAVSCLSVDGFIGANLMKKAIWKIDTDKQLITITNAVSVLELPSNVKRIPFGENFNGSPTITMHLSGQKAKEIVVDLGSNGGIEIQKRIFDKLKKKKSIASSTYGFGSLSSGLYGRYKQDTSFYAKTSSLSFGEIKLRDQIVLFKKKSDKIGMKFFENYTLIFNWFDKELIVFQNKEYDNTKLESYGFSFQLLADALVVSYLIKDSSAEKKGLKIGDRIMVMNGKDYSQISLEDFCEIINDNVLHGNKNIHIIARRGEESISFDLEKMTLLN